MKMYEFWCRECGNHSYREDVTMSVCPDDETVLELAATVETQPHLNGIMGMEAVYSERKTIDKRSRK